MIEAVVIVARRVERLARRTAAGITLSAIALAAHAQQRPPALTQGDEVIAMPGIGRVLLAFVIVAGLAVAAVLILKRVLPRFAPALLPSGAVQVVERASLGAGLRVHVIQFEGERIMLAEKRDAVALVRLGNSLGNGDGKS